MFEEIINTIVSWVWSDWLVYFLLGSGICYTLLLRFFQVRLFKDMLSLLVRGESSRLGVSSYQALAMSISLRVGVGNIAGVATAIGAGGPGAVFWMWVLGLLGTATSFHECTLAQAYKKSIGDQYRSGPAYYMEKGLGLRWYGILFAFTCVLDYGIAAPGVQSSVIAASLKETFHLHPAISGLLICIPLGFVIFGGVKRIARFSQTVVPVMAGLYILIAFVIVLVNIEKLPDVFRLIFSSAFGFDPVYGGIIGSAIAWGMRRGIYSNEAGMGSAPHIAGAAEVSHPAKQGLVQALSVYIDTILVCSATAFMLLFSGAYNVADGAGGFIVENLPGVEAGPVFAIRAVETLLHSYGGIFVSVAIFFFAFTTIMAFSYIGENNVIHFCRKESDNTVPLAIFRIVLLLTTFWGTMHTQTVGWVIGDIGIGIMVWLNLIALVVLLPKTRIILKDYERQRKEGKDPVFQPQQLGLENMEYWSDSDNQK